MNNHAPIAMNGAVGKLIGEPCCANCKFLKSYPNGAMKCHRGAPTALIVMGQAPNNQPVHLYTMSDWPPTQAVQWCGEHQRKIVAA